VAEEYFHKLNKNPSIKAISRGLIMGGSSDRIQRAIAKRMLGIDIAKRGPKPLELPMLKKANLIVVVANDVPEVVFDYWKQPLMEKVIIWRVTDEQMMKPKNIERIIRKIKVKVESLVRRLDRQPTTK